MVNIKYLSNFVETPRKFIIAELSIRNEDPSLPIESSAIINLRGVSTKLKSMKQNRWPFMQCDQTGLTHATTYSSSRTNIQDFK